MALGLRYPKSHGNACIRSSASGVNSNNPSAFGRFLVLADPANFYLNPARYSEVRKISFWMNCALLDPTPPASERIRLRVAISSSSQVAIAPVAATIVPGATFRTRGGASIYPGSPNDEAALFTKGGDWETLQDVAAFSDRSSTFVLVEFDRFAASSADFFNAWDAMAASNGADDYCKFQLIPESESNDWSVGGRTNSLMFLGGGCSVVQAPTGVNRTTTIFSMNGWISYGSESTSFGTPRGWPIVWREADWDNVTSVHAWSFLPTSGGAGTWNMEMEVAALLLNGGSNQATQRYTESFSDVIGVSNVDAGHRSLDILPSIVDGDNLSMEWRKLVGTSIGQPYGYFEVIQEDFNKTVCPHPAAAGGPISISEVGHPNQFYYSKGYFDPEWYQDFPENLILYGQVWGGFKHASAIDVIQTWITINADMQADPATSGFNALISPAVSSTPVVDFGYKLQDGEIGSNNPINLAGPRTLITQIESALWTAGQPGGMTLAYGLNVPNREFLDLGPLFDVGAFNPEGCAATSAGLGDNPGILVITNGSVPPKKFNPVAAGTNGEIEDAGMPLPFPEEVPSFIVDDTALSPAGGLELGFYNYRYTFRNCCTGKESDPSDTVLVDTTGASPGAKVTLSFAGVRIPSDPQICEICIYRTNVSLTEGGLTTVVLAKVGCFDVDATSIFVDDLADDELDFLNDGLSLLNAPMPCVPIVVDFRNRLFGMGDIPNLTPAGTVSVVNGSDIILGDGSVEWDRCLEGKFIQVGADCRAYEIDRILPPESGTSPPIARLRLTEEYEGTTDSALQYTICGRPNRLYISEPLEGECWPAANFLDIEPGDGDRLMGAVSNFDRLVICKRRKTYVLTFRESPATEVIVPSRISSDIGCIGPRTFAQVASGSVWLSDRGLALFDGRSVQHLPASDAMADLFTNTNNPRYVRRDRNGRVIDAVGIFYPKREQYLLLLPTIQTDRGCNLMLVWDVSLNNITLLEFCQEFQSMVLGKDSDGNERVYLGDTNGFVWIFDVGYTDGVGYPNATGTVRGKVSSAGTSEFGVAELVYDPGGFITGGVPSLGGLSGLAGLSGALAGEDMGLAGVCVYTRGADAALDDPWTARSIFASTDTKLYLTPPWGAEEPAPGDDFMIGPIDFDCIFKPQNYGTDLVSKRNWGHVVVHQKEDFSSKLRVLLMPDFRQIDPEELTVIDPVTQETGEGRVFRMDYELGRQRHPVGRDVHFYEAVRFKNFAPEEPIRILNHILIANPRSSN